MKYCPKCGVKYEDDKIYCPICGSKLLHLEENKGNILALNSEVEATGGDILAYKSKVSEIDSRGNPQSQEVMAVRSKVAGGHIVEGNYVHQSVHINMIGIPSISEQHEEFYLFYLDEKGNERKIRVEDEIEIYRRDNSWEVVAWDGSREIELGIKDLRVSRKSRCLKIGVKNGMFYVKDYGMRNGVYVNGRRIRGEVLVSPGDVISVGTLVMRIEKNPKQVSVKRNSVMFIDRAIAKYIREDLLHMVNGKYYVDATGLKPGEVINAGDRKIVVEDSLVRDSILVAKQIISTEDAYFIQKIRENLEELPKNIRIKIEKLLKLYDESEEEMKYLYKNEIFKLLEGMK